MSGELLRVVEGLIGKVIELPKLRVRIKNAGSGGLEITPIPAHVRLKPGGSTVVRLVARLRGAPPHVVRPALMGSTRCPLPLAASCYNN